MSKKNPWHWYYGIPEFHMAHRFVYLEDLINEERLLASAHYGIYWEKQKLYYQAKDAAESVANELEEQTVINNALEFLKNVADNERNKELLVIKDYQKHLENILPKDDKTINKLLQKINSNILDDPSEINDFYLNLTKYINEARQGAENYKNRLMRFKEHNDKEMSELAQDSYEFRALGDLEGTLNNLIGIATRGQEKKVEGFIGKLRQATFDYIMESNLISYLQSGEDVAAAFAIVQLDIEKKCQEFLDQHFNEYTDLSQLETEIDKIIENYFKKDSETDTKLQKAIQENNEQLDIMLDSAKNILGLKQLAKGKAEREIKSDTRTALLSKQASLRKQLKGIVSKEIMNELKFLSTAIPQITKKKKGETESISRQTFHGNLFELIEIVQEGNTIKVRGKNGTDIIHLGSMSFDIQPSNLQAALLQPIKKIEAAMTDYDNEKRKDRNDTREKAHKSMNKKITESVNLLEKEIKELQLDIEDLFIYHESLKLYKSAETNEMSSFEGRDMIILNYLDELYTANNLGGLQLPQKEGLEFLALNLSSLAVGGNYKSTLTSYLSIFAGLLMFDDIYNMAVEAEKMIHSATPYKTVKQIHLYNLNGIYVPASMILTYTYTTMSQLKEAIDSHRAAKVTISTSAADSAIEQYLADRPLPLKQQWFNLGNQVSSGTHIRVLFLAGFVQLLEQLNDM